MTTQTTDRSRRDLKDWESPSRLLARYLQTGGAQALGAVCCGLGFLVLTYGWWKISKEAVVALQVPYLVSGGLGGILLLGLGGILLVTHQLRLDNRRLEALEESVAELRDLLLADVAEMERERRVVEHVTSNGHNGSSGAPVPDTGTETAGPTSGLVRVPGGSRVHATDCAVVSGKAVTTVDVTDVEDLPACKLCSPTV